MHVALFMVLHLVAKNARFVIEFVRIAPSPPYLKAQSIIHTYRNVFILFLMKLNILLFVCNYVYR